jgi:hypothetical protein
MANINFINWLHGNFYFSVFGHGFLGCDTKIGHEMCVSEKSMTRMFEKIETSNKEE